MSDFLISLSDRFEVGHLSNLLKRPYGKYFLSGKSFTYNWGRIHILHERFAKNNIFASGQNILCWVGDFLCINPEETAEMLCQYFSNKLTQEGWISENLQKDKIFEQLNGAFALIMASPKSLLVITDPFAFIPVYVGKDANGRINSIGTHPDLVAGISSDELFIDEVSVAEYLLSGNSTFPNTMHKNVQELGPGQVHWFSFENQRVDYKASLYWKPPNEIIGQYNEDDLAEELRSALVSSVIDRCHYDKVGVLLSGGLDSRAILAAVPKDINCVAITFGEELNREATIAKKVAACYNRQWHFLQRDTEFLANSMTGVVRLMGCECEWVNAHAYGFADAIYKLGTQILLNGELFDSYFKGWVAHDYMRRPRLHGLIPPHYVKRSFDYIYHKNFWENQPQFWPGVLQREYLEQVYSRRRKHYETYYDNSRGSIELLLLYPFSHFIDGSALMADRRVLPMVLVATDRRLLDFAFKCPFHLKLGKKMFLKAVLPIYGPGRKIPDASNGVRPGSSNTFRVFQRSIRKTEEALLQIWGQISKKSIVTHSWTNYQHYWQTSAMIKELTKLYQNHLFSFDGVLFTKDSASLLSMDGLDWRCGFRLLHLAIWKATATEFLKEARGYTNE